MEDNRNTFPFLFCIWLILFCAKITEHIDWSWWLVFLPLYLPLAFVIATAVIVSCFLVLFGIIWCIIYLGIWIYEEITERL